MSKIPVAGTKPIKIEWQSIPQGDRSPWLDKCEKCNHERREHFTANTDLAPDGADICDCCDHEQFIEPVNWRDRVNIKTSENKTVYTNNLNSL